MVVVVVVVVAGIGVEVRVVVVRGGAICVNNFQSIRKHHGRPPAGEQ